MGEFHSDSHELPEALERGPLIVRAGAGVGLSREQFYSLGLLNRELRLERTAEGDVIVMPPVGGRTGSRNSNLLVQVGIWADSEGRGITFDSSTGFELSNGATRAPDVSWVTRARLIALSPEQKERFPPLCPEFVLELLSPSDSLPMVQVKMAEYIACGALLGWLIDPSHRRVYVYRPGVPVEERHDPATLSGDPVLAGFVLDLAPVWDPGF